jgi:hypothetical protein
VLPGLAVAVVVQDEPRDRSASVYDGSFLACENPTATQDPAEVHDTDLVSAV